MHIRGKLQARRVKDFLNKIVKRRDEEKDKKCSNLLNYLCDIQREGQITIVRGQLQLTTLSLNIHIKKNCTRRCYFHLDRSCLSKIRYVQASRKHTVLST